MAVLTGIDEAGLGPILGPLVVSSVAFSIPDELLGEDLWYQLRKSISKNRRHQAGRLIVADSKKVYKRKSGIGELERTVLSVLTHAGCTPGKLEELLRFLAPDVSERLMHYPWHSGALQRSITDKWKEYSIASGMFADDLKQNEIVLEGVECQCMDVQHYNRIVESVRNKSRVLFSTTSTLIQRAFQRWGKRGVEVVVDRQGGTMRYLNGLQRVFEKASITVESEGPKRSSYCIEDVNGKMRVHFLVGADQKHLPVSLASMTSKYVRELLVDNINRYFIDMHSEIKPTAGYWTDGSRFIKDVRAKLPHVAFDTQQLIRSR